MTSPIQLNSSCARLALGLTILSAFLLLIACTSSAPTPAPAPDQQTQSAKTTIWVGTVESLEGDVLSVATVDGVILAALSDDTTLQHFAAGSQGDLSVGQQVSIIGRDGEGGIVASSVVVTPEGTSLFGSTDSAGGQGGRPGGRRVMLRGTIESFDGLRVMVDTQQGPVVVSISERTAVQVPSDAPIEELSLGQLVTVTGVQSEGESIEVSTIFIMPDMASLFGGRRRSEGQDSAAPGGRGTAGDTPTPVFVQERRAGENEGFTFLVTQDSKATFTVRERLALLPLPNSAVMRTTALSGEVHFDGRSSVVEIDLHQLTSDQSLRDGYVRRSMFPDHPIAVFTVKDARPLPAGFTDGKEVVTQVTGQTGNPRR